MLLNIKELYWAAGFIEGEGCFNHCFRKNRVSNDFRVTACQVEIEPLLRLKQLFGGTIHKQKNGNGVIHIWQTYCTRARGIAMTLFPLMSHKRQEQIKVMLSHQWYKQMRKNGRFISPREVI